MPPAVGAPVVTAAQYQVVGQGDLNEYLAGWLGELEMSNQIFQGYVGSEGIWEPW